MIDLSIDAGIVEAIRLAWKDEPILQSNIPCTDELQTNRVFEEFADPLPDTAIFAVITDLGSDENVRASGRKFFSSWDVRIDVYHEWKGVAKKLANRIKEIVANDEWAEMITSDGTVNCFRLTGEQGPLKLATRTFRWRCTLQASVSQNRSN